ncbi:MAG: TerD family protein [Dactylosporangium sp.]|nr:TerD family protein [Dactylosporangium sp.]NNJ62680.1 TerD family protein [Dactylosporangium sp.]
MATELAKGQNTPLTAGRVVVTVQVALSTDVSALLVGAGGKVRSDADFVFYNQPTGPGVSLRPSAGGGAASIEIDVAAVPADIDKVRVVVSIDGSGQRFGQVQPPTVVLSDSAGTPLVSYGVSGLTTETIMIPLELYRRAGAWKVRAVGQGYAGGLADLITDHGVVVDGTPQPAATPPPPVAPVTAPPPVAPAMAPPPVAPAMAPPPPAPVMAPPPSAPPERGVGGPGGPVNLTKGERVSLRKRDGSGLTRVRMGLGWDPVRTRSLFGSREVEIDLDASAIMFADQQPVDVVFYNHARSKDGSILHTGDNRTGHGEGDDESIIVELGRVPAHVNTIVFVVTSYTGQTFAQVENAFCRLVDEMTGAELVRYTLSGGTACTATIMTKLYREGGAWKMAAIGEGAQGRTPLDLLPVVGSYL